MKLSQVLSQISQLAKNKGISRPFIVGGLPRDKILKRYNDFGDVDLTTGDKDIHELSKLVAKHFAQFITSHLVMPDGHSRIMMGGIKFDFSSNFKIPGIKYLLKHSGFQNVTEMQKELYSRDFTCNSTLMSLNLEKIIDPTNLAIKDIEKKLIRTCLPPRITLGYDNNRIIRAMYLSAKLDFDIDPKVIEWIKQNTDKISNIRPQYLVKKTNKAIKYNKIRVVDFLNKTGLWDKFPTFRDLSPYLSQGLIRS